MQKRAGKRLMFGIAIINIFLLIGMILATAFIFASTLSLSSAQVSITTIPKKSGSGVNIASIPREGSYIPGQEFYFTRETSFNLPVRVEDSVTKIVQKSGGGADIYYKSGAIDEFSAEQYAPIRDKLLSDKIIPTQKEYNFFGIKTFYGGGAHLLQGASWALQAAGAIQLIGSLAGLDSQTTRALQLSAVGGIMAGKTVASLGPSGFNKLPVDSIFAKAGTQFAIGLVVAVAIFVLTYKKEKKTLVSFQCLPWEPPIGGQFCEQCNKDPFRPCSEYRCRSLGQACELLNKGTANEQCAWVNRNDVVSPKITPSIQALRPKELNLKYVPDNAIRPPAVGTKIVTGSAGCVPAFTPLEFGITTNEPAQCKIDYNHTSSFEQMQYYFGESNYYAYNHTQKMRLPGPNTGADGPLAPLLKNDGTFALYVRCQDANGNENVDEYVFSFCVDKGPDTTPPIIEEFSIPSESPVTFNQDRVPIEVYINEPSECKWSRESKAYEDMENNLACLTESFQVNADLQYTCSGNLTGVKNREDNKFYFRCKDQPDKVENVRNVNVQSKELVLKGSEPLLIASLSPNETIFGSTDVVSLNLGVETSNGAEEGKAVCYFSDTGQRDSYIAMFETNSYLHKQSLSLISGNYSYFFRCIDAGGNAVEGNIRFNVFVDKKEPRVTRAYRQEGLKIVTDEDAECTYSLSSCNFNFEEGIKMIYSNPSVKNNHFAEWKPNAKYFVKCRDQYGNLPSPAGCSIVVSAVELNKQAL